MTGPDAEARGLARQARAALESEVARHRDRARAEMQAGSLRNPVARRRVLDRMQRADPTLFLAADRGRRASEINVFLARTILVKGPARLAIGAWSIMGSARRGEIEVCAELAMILSLHAQERLVRRFKLETHAHQLAALKVAWVAMNNGIAGVVAREAAAADPPEADFPARIGVGRHYYLPCASGLAVVAWDEPLIAEAVTVLDPDLLDAEQEAILARWTAALQARRADAAPPLNEVEAVRW